MTAEVYTESASAPVLVEVSGDPDPGDPDPGNPDPGDPDPGDPDPGDPDPGDPDPECPVEVLLDVGHVDVGARIVNGDLRTQIKDDTQGGPPVWRDLETVAFHVKPEGHVEVPPGEAFDFIGSSGSDIWVIPQTQDPDLIWAGWNTEEIDYSLLDGSVTWFLDEVDGPSNSTMAIFQIGSFGTPIVHFNSSEPLPQSLDLPMPTHAHGNWAFTEEGIYELTMGHEATLASGEELSDDGTLLVAVGDVDLDDLCPDPDPGDPGNGDPDPGDPDPGDRGPGDPDPGDPGDRSDRPDRGDPGDPNGSGNGALGGSPRAGSPVGAGSSSAPCPTPSRALSGGAASPATAARSSSPGSSSPGSSPSGSGETVILDVGHVDYAARVVDGDLVSEIKDDTVPGSIEWRSPASVVFHLKREAETQVPDTPAFSFLGQPGATIWQIPQTQDPNLLWLGWNTEEIGSDEVSGAVSWTLDGIDGPGGFALYEFDAFGQPNVIFDSAGDTYGIPLGTHAHGNWAFTEEGVYRLTFTHTASLASGGSGSDTQTVTMVVGDVDPSSVAPAGSSSNSSDSSNPGNDDDDGGAEGGEGGGDGDDEAGSATPAMAPQSSSGGSSANCPALPKTGSDIGMLVLVGLLLSAGGAACVYAARRRRRVTLAPST